MNADLRIVLDVAIAMVLGGLVGLEREVARRPAGFRTHMLVAGAAAFLVGLADPMLDFFAPRTEAALHFDPVRIIEAIVTGVSFIGAGTIFFRQRGEQVEGLTTAASVLLSSAIGIAVGLREITVAIGVTVLTLTVLLGLGWIEQRAQRFAKKTSRTDAP